MNVWKSRAISGEVYFSLANTLGEAHRDARKFFGEGVSFSTKESSLEEFAAWVDSLP